MQPLQAIAFVLPESLAWVSPLQAAALVAQHETHWALLYSGQRLTFTGRFSYLCLCPQETLAGEEFALLRIKLSDNRPRFDNAWFGYFGYEMLHDTGHFDKTDSSFISLAVSCFTRFGMILQFDHDSRTVTVYKEPQLSTPTWLTNEWDAHHSNETSQPVVTQLTSTISRERYLSAVEETKEAIARGDFYQANITRKFTGTFATTPDAFTLFEKLCAASPAAYSAFMRLGDTAILSSSPERFITIDSQGTMQTRPIKGTAPRMHDAQEDRKQREHLQTSEKDRAENLMIVDLMRNDLARSCEAGSVKVENLFEVTTYATLHHMASTVTGKKKPAISTLNALKSCFPPGSMTGAPKIAAMQWCAKQEQIQRGVYSGALGWFGGDGSCDLCVVIRTLILQGNRFEFQVGGGIVADSNPQAEWRETITKARGIMKALGLDVQQLEDI